MKHKEIMILDITKNGKAMFLLEYALKIKKLSFKDGVTYSLYCTMGKYRFYREVKKSIGCGKIIFEGKK